MAYPVYAEIGAPQPPFLDPFYGYVEYDPVTKMNVTYYSYPFYPPSPRSNPSELVFYDQPTDSRLPNSEYMEFETRLVGETPSSFFGDILARWTWKSNYNAAYGGVSIVGPPIQLAIGAPANVGGVGGVTLTSINGVPITAFSAFSNKLEGTSISFQLVSTFTLGSTSDGINPLAEPIALNVGSYMVTIPAHSFHITRKGHYVYEGTINAASLEVQIVPSTATTYTLKAEVSGTTPISLGNPALVALRIGNDMGVGFTVPDDNI